LVHESNQRNLCTPHFNQIQTAITYSNMHYELSPNPKKVAQMARKIAMDSHGYPFHPFNAFPGDGGDQALQARGLVVHLGPRDARQNYAKKNGRNGDERTISEKKIKMEDIIFSMVYTWFTYELYGLDMVYIGIIWYISADPGRPQGGQQDLGLEEPGHHRRLETR
jgi:hypothetical protein